MAAAIPAAYQMRQGFGRRCDLLFAQMLECLAHHFGFALACLARHPFEKSGQFLANSDVQDTHSLVLQHVTQIRKPAPHLRRSLHDYRTASAHPDPACPPSIVFSRPRAMQHTRNSYRMAASSLLRLAMETVKTES